LAGGEGKEAEGTVVQKKQKLTPFSPTTKGEIKKEREEKKKNAGAIVEGGRDSVGTKRGGHRDIFAGNHRKGKAQFTRIGGGVSGEEEKGKVGPAWGKKSMLKGFNTQTCGK